MKIRQIAEKTAKIIGCTAVLAFFSALSADKVAAEDIGAEVCADTTLIICSEG